ncbi:MAG: DUF1800 family protein [Chthoniobacterales bacterium]
MPRSINTSDWKPEFAAHLIRRTSFAATKDEIQKFADMSPQTAVEHILQPPKEKVKEEDTGVDFASYFQEKDYFRKFKRSDTKREEIRQKFVKNRNRMTADLRGWWLERMRKVRPSALESLTLFWHGHFATSIRKVKDPYYMFKQNQTFREGALGSMVDLAKAVAQDPAMMIYLDVNKSEASAPNENFAREIFELFLLGEGNYTEKDIGEAARAFAGYRINQNGKVIFRKKFADPGRKTIFGKTRRWEAEDVVDLAFEQPACARFLAKRLWEYYAGVSASPEDLEKMASSLRSKKFNTSAWLQEIFLSKGFYSPEVMARQIKSPVQWLVGSCISLGRPLPPVNQANLMIRQQGQELFAPPNVRGWVGGRSWINSATLSARYTGSRKMIYGFNRKKRAMKQAGSMQMAEGRKEKVVKFDMIDGSSIFKTLDQISKLLLAQPADARLEGELYEKYANAPLPVSNKIKCEIAHRIMAAPEYQLI